MNVYRDALNRAIVAHGTTPEDVAALRTIREAIDRGFLTRNTLDAVFVDLDPYREEAKDA